MRAPPPVVSAAAYQEREKKRVQALPFLHAFVQLKRLTRGEENIPQTIWIKQSACQQPRRLQAAKSSKRKPVGERLIPAWGTCTDFASKRCTRPAVVGGGG
jgi:hypothetical protein